MFPAEKRKKTGAQQVFFLQAAQGKGRLVNLGDLAVRGEFHHPFGQAVEDEFMVPPGKEQLRGDVPLEQVFSAQDGAGQFVEGAVVEMFDDFDDMLFGFLERTLGNAGIGPEFEDIGFILEHGGRVDDDPDLFQFGPAADNLAELFPVDVGHDQVGKNDVRPHRIKCLQGGKPVYRSDHLMPLFFEEFHQQFQENRVVFHYQNCFHGVLGIHIPKFFVSVQQHHICFVIGLKPLPEHRA